MKIAVFSDCFYPELSGISDSIIILAKALAKSGNQVHFFVPKYSVKNYQTAKLFLQEPDLGKNIKIHRLFSLPFGSGTGQARLAIPSPWHWMSVKKFDPDIIHTHLFFGVGLDALMSAKIYGIPIVGTNHTAISEFIRYSPVKAEWLKTFSLKYAVWYYNRCDYVSAPSQLGFDEMEQYGFCRPHKVIPNPVELDVFIPASPDERREQKKKFGLSDTVLVYAGRLAPEKNIDVLIRALVLVKKRFPDVVLLLAGHGSMSERLKNLAAMLHVENSVRFLGTVDRGTLARIYHASDIFVISSTSEMQSMSILQAMASGLPVVSVNVRAPNYIHNQSGFLVEQNDDTAFAEKIILLFKDAPLRKKFAKNASSFVQRFSLSNIAREWENIYNDVRVSHKNNMRYIT